MNFKIVSIFALIIFIWVIVLALKKSSWLNFYVIEDIKNFLLGGPFEFEKKARKRWKKIEKRLKSNQEADWKLAVIEGEEIVSEVLSEMGFLGKEIKKQLSHVKKAQIPQINELLWASGIYSNIIKDPDFALKKEEAKKVLQIFKEFLKTCEYL